MSLKELENVMQMFLKHKNINEDAMKKIFGTLITTALIALIATVISNTIAVNLNAQEIVHERNIQEVMHQTLNDNLDKQIKHLENIEAYLREIARKNN